MKVICDRGALLEAVNLVAGVVASRTPRPQLTCIKLEAIREDGVGEAGRLVLSGTDAEISIRLVSHQVEVQEAGEVLIPADKLKQIVGAEDNEPTLTLSCEGETTTIRGRDAFFKVFGYKVAEFPPMPEFPGPDAPADTFSVRAGVLRELISRTTFSTARENSRYAINGVLMRLEDKKLEMVATDGRRLALSRTNSIQGRTTAGNSGDVLSCIIPTKALTMASRLLPLDDQEVRFAVTDNQVIMSFDGGDGETILASNLVEGTFPPYEDVIPKDQDKRATFDVTSLSSAVRRAALLTNEESRGVRLSFGHGDQKLKLSSRAPEMGEAEIEIEIGSYEGDDIEIGFNPAFITDALKVLPGQEVIFEMKAPNKPGLIRSGNDFLYVVMPVNLT